MAAPTVGSTWSPNTSYTLKVLSVDTTNQIVRAKIYARSKTLTEYARLANYYDNSANGYRYRVADVTGCFKNCTNFKTVPEISDNLTRISDCSEMFYNCTSLINTYNFYDWLKATWNLNSDGEEYLPKTYNLTRTFQGCSSLVNISRTLPYGIKIGSMNLCFSDCKKLQRLPMNNSETEYDMECFFGYHNAGEVVEDSHRQVEVQNMIRCFSGCDNLQYMPIPLPKNLQDMVDCFLDCRNLTTSGYDYYYNIPYTILDMTYAFAYCSSLKTVAKLIEPPPLGENWALTSLTGCFSGCTSLEYGLQLESNISEAPNLRYIDDMYFNCEYLNNWGTLSAITYSEVLASGLFKNVDSFSTIDFRDINNDFPNIYLADSMFEGWENLDEILHFEEFNIVVGSHLFDGCRLLDMWGSTIILPNTLDKIDYMFANTSSSFNIKITNSYWNPGASDYEGLFQNTSRDIYLLYNQQRSIDVILQGIGRSYNNVHYCGDDLLPPTVTLDILRVSSSGSRIEDRSGTWVYINTTVNYPQQYVPYDYSYRFYNRDFKIDGHSRQFSTWYSLGDLYTHTISVCYGGILRDENDEEIPNTDKYSETISKVLPSGFALLDFLPGGQGMAIGHFADKKGLDINYPTMIGEGLSTPLINGEIDLTKYQLVVGKYNEIVDDALFIVGAGSSNNKSNVFVIDENGNLDLRSRQNSSSERYSGLNINHDPYIDDDGFGNITKYDAAAGSLSAILDYTNNNTTYQHNATISASSNAYSSMGNTIQLESILYNTTQATPITVKSAFLTVTTTETNSSIEMNADNIYLNSSGDLTLKGHASSIGTIYECSDSDVSLTGTDAQNQSVGKTILSLTGNDQVPAGCWTGYIYVNFSAAATGNLGVTISTSNTDASWSIQQVATTGTYYGTRVRIPTLLNIANDTNYYIRAWSGVGCTVTTVRVRLMRIK